MTATSASAAAPGAAPADSGDAALFARLRADGFAGPVWEATVDRLVRYGYQVLRARIGAGDIFAVCAAKRIRGVPAAASWQGWSNEDINDLVQETLITAVGRFSRDAATGRGWRPDGGAALTTYFAGACLIAFVATYNRHRTRRNRHTAALAAAARVQPASAHPDVADMVIDALTAAERLARAIPDPRLRFVLRQHAAGYQHAEISQLLADGTTPRAVEGMIYRARKQATKGEADDSR